MHLRAHRLALVAGVGALLLGLVSAPAWPAAASTGSQAPPADPYAPAYGHPYRHGAVPTTAQSTKMKSFERAQTSTTASSNSTTLSYGGGIDGIGVTSGIPKVYLVFWGSQWGIQGSNSSGDLTFSNDPDNGAPYIQEMFKGLGTNSETWSAVMTQYCDGSNVLNFATSCAATAAHVGYPKGTALAGVWYDSSVTEPSTATADQIAQEAIKSAGHFGNSSAAANRYAQYVILSAHNLNPDNYQSPSTGFCAWHDYNGDATLDGGGAVPSPYGDIAFTNMPYLMDLGVSCGQGAVNSPGILDGYSIVAGHEYAETITDQNPAGGWSNNNTQSTNYGAENADECAWIKSGQGAMQDVAFSTGSFAMQSTWSNSNTACELTDPIIQNDLTSALSGGAQNATAGTTYANPLVAKVTDPYGTPVQGASVTFTAPSSGAQAMFGSPCSGTTCVVLTDSSGDAVSPPLTANSNSGTFTVTAADPKTAVPATFSLTNLAGIASHMNIVSGTPQSIGVGTPYAPFKVSLTDTNGNGVPGLSVTFAGPSSGAGLTFGPCAGGNVPASTCTVTTDSQGVATSSTPTANSVLGSFTVTASSSGLPSQSFALTNVIGPASVISVTSGSGQSALAGGAGFASPLTVTVTDQFGHPVPGAPVTFSAPLSGPTATFSSCAGGNPNPFECVVLTDTNGVATSSALETGTAPGPYSITVSVPGATPAQVAFDNLQNGYYLVASDGGIFTHGGAPFLGSTGGMHLNAPIVGMAVAPGGGYYLVASDGGIFNFGAPFLGSAGGMHLNAPIVGMAVAPGGGYYLVASDGGIFNFGAPYLGGTGAIHLNKPIVAMAVTQQGGYYLVASDGGIFNFGAPYLGSTGAIKLNKAIVGMSVDPLTGGYWLVASDGGIFNFDAPFYGSEGGSPLNEPMVGMAASAVMPGG